MEQWQRAMRSGALCIMPFQTLHSVPYAHATEKHCDTDGAPLQCMCDTPHAPGLPLPMLAGATI